MGGTFARASPVADGGGGPQGQKGIAVQCRLLLGGSAVGGKSSANLPPPGPPRPRTPGNFLAGQKVTKEPLKGRGIPISPFP